MRASGRFWPLACAIEGWKSPGKPLDQMTVEEQLEFQRDCAASVDASYTTLKFVAYQTMNQNDALEMNMKGHIPHLDSAQRRIADLEDEVRRLRALAPPSQQQGGVLVLDRDHPEARDSPSLGERLRAVFQPQR